jgi:hypothetical protein
MKALGKGSIASWVQVGLQVAWWLLWFAAVCLVIAAIGYGVVYVMIANGQIDPSFLSGGDGRIQAGDGDGAFSITYDDPHGFTWPVAIPVFLIGATAIAGSLVIVWRLRRLFESFTSGEPFRRENANHLRVIWITMVAVEISRWLLMALTGFLLVQFANDSGSEVSIELEGERLSTWMSILILICLAEVFREGARLKEEQELTI